MKETKTDFLNLVEKTIDEINRMDLNKGEQTILLIASEKHTTDDDTSFAMVDIGLPMNLITNLVLAMEKDSKLQTYIAVALEVLYKRQNVKDKTTDINQN